MQTNKTIMHLTIIELTMRPCGSRLLKRLMSPSPISQVMFASAFSWIDDFSYFWHSYFFRYGHFVEYVTKPCNEHVADWCSWRWLWGRIRLCTHACNTPRGSCSKAIANDYRHEYQHGCGLWTLVITRSAATRGSLSSNQAGPGSTGWIKAWTSVAI